MGGGSQLAEGTKYDDCSVNKQIQTHAYTRARTHMHRNNFKVVFSIEIIVSFVLIECSDVQTKHERFITHSRTTRLTFVLSLAHFKSTHIPRVTR